MSSVRIGLIGLAAMVAAVLCGGTAMAGSKEDVDVLHEVRVGDNLHLISGYYYGDARQWERIWLANNDLIENPNQIEPGLWLRIPDATVPAELYDEFLHRMGVFVTAVPLPAADTPAPVPVAAEVAPPGPPKQ